MKIGAHTRILLAVILALLLIPLVANRASGDGSFKSFKLTAGPANAGTSKQFGFSVAVSGDTMVIGDFEEHAAYVFERNNGKWSEVARLTGSNGFSYFGYSVAISVDTVVVGAPFDYSFVGAAYVFKRDNGTWNKNPETILVDGDLQPFSFANFGWSLAFEGSTLMVGVPGANATYFYSPEGAKWPAEEAKLTANDTDVGDRFGWAVAISGSRVVVGAPRDESTAGSAYVFDFDGAGWLETAKLTASDKAIHDDFGYSVAIDQDTVVVGAHKDYSYVTEPGAAYVFSFDGKGWLETAKLTTGAVEDYNQFGSSVAIKGSTMLVGAPFLLAPEYNPDSKPGAAYLFEFDGSSWSEKAKLTAADAGDPPKIDLFGTSLAINGATLVVGAIDADAEGQDAGAAFGFVNNEPPVAVASWDPKEGIIEGDEITLDGSDSYDPDGDPLTYRWEQTGGPDVGLDLLLAKRDASDPVRTFVAPELSEGCAALSFQLTVTDDKGAPSEPAPVEITIFPNNRIHAKLGGKHRHWLYWHKYSFYGHENDEVVITLEADPNGWHRGSKVTLILKDKIRGARLFKTNRGGVPNTISATLPADGTYTVYVLKQPWFWSWWRHNRFEGDYILSLEGTCGKLVNGSQCKKR